MVTPHRRRVVVAGAGFAGLAAAAELRARLGARHEITVISKSAELIYTPALPWLPFGACSRDDVATPLAHTLEAHDVRFVHAEITRFHLARRVVTTKSGDVPYDHLLIATGWKPNHAAVPGLGPRGYSHSVMSLHEAEGARRALEGLSRAPGPIVVGMAQGASCARAARDLLRALLRWRSEAGLEDRVPVTYLTPRSAEQRAESSSVELDTESTCAEAGVPVLRGAVLRDVQPAHLTLGDGRRVPFSLALLLPPVLGAEAARAALAIVDASGFVRVDAQQRTAEYPEVSAAGTAIAALPGVAIEPDQASCEATGCAAARHIASEIQGGSEPLAALLTPAREPSSAPLGAVRRAWAREALARYFPRA